MPDIRPPSRTRLKLALLGVLGGAVILLPLVQVLRYQNSRVDELLAQRAALEPLSLAVAAQRALLGHGEAAGLVLQGRTQLESERRLRQAQVDEQLWVLNSALTAGYWARAMDENTTLTLNWRELARRITRRQIGAGDSRVGHELLVEQAVQVMDLISAAAPSSAYTQLALLALPRAEPAAPAATQAAALARLDGVITRLAAHGAQLDTELVELRGQRGALGLALAALASVLLGALALASRARAAGAGASGGDDLRRGSGRRASDPPTPRTVSGRLIHSLRHASPAVADEPLPTRPPPQ